jgi:hypothetical protein
MIKKFAVQKLADYWTTHNIKLYEVQIVGAIVNTMQIGDTQGYLIREEICQQSCDRELVQIDHLKN